MTTNLSYFFNVQTSFQLQIEWQSSFHHLESMETSIYIYFHIKDEGK